MAHGPVAAGRDEAMAALFAAHYAGLLRLAVLLADGARAEDAVQEAFARLYGRWRTPPDPERALPYLRSYVLDAVRSAPAGAGEHGEVLTALRTLPRREREVLVLRHHLDLTDAEIAETLGITTGSVRRNASRGIAALSRELEGR